jgi:tetratricopeptide (TPR) repeat protein
MRTTVFVAMLVASAGASADEHAHSHPAPEKLGTVHFETTCAAPVRAQFDRAVALLHSFAYEVAAAQFREVATKDKTCAMAHWGIAMTVYHQLWSPPSAADLKLGREEIQLAQQIGAHSERERALIDAAAAFFSDTDPAHHPARAKAYEAAMAPIAQRFPKDDEAQLFYALALLATAPPTDRTHANQKKAASILEPMYKRLPDHPGVPHYLIHAYDSQELAPKGITAARAYAKIAPSAPHALHMPSHIFTRLGLWDDSIESNQAARSAARAQGDVGEELHAMDYLTYAFLQRGRTEDARHILDELHAKGSLLGQDFKVGYAATAMPVRFVIEREQWSDALALEPLPGTAPHVSALVYWAHALAHARSGHADQSSADVAEIEACEARSKASGDTYWSAQIGVLAKEARAWASYAAGRSDEAVALLRAAADTEDSLEKLPVTPGPVVPAREQLGQLLLALNKPREALQELTQALKDAPGRRAGLEAAARAADVSGDRGAAAAFRKQLGA